MRLRALLRNDASLAHQAHRIRLGELVAGGLDRVRTADTQALIGALAPHAAVVAEPERVGPGSGIHVAFLVARAHTADFERAAEDLARHWNGRVTLRLVGPTAPYDFADPAAAWG